MYDEGDRAGGRERGEGMAFLTVGREKGSDGPDRISVNGPCSRGGWPCGYAARNVEGKEKRGREEGK